MEIIRSYSAST